ncbi:RsmB/NOP family class I SAM-dependent RNA methyltransferase [Boudabousia marimammalium]|uniref:SAM-dependent MTase RsmB/NOP-type domain-containing protein n=1 Tax=Boudabousia marimammalium TaxID=156892 RepID=A0A1Q5PQS9_9ACTO|nr:transcription antitermination factor NusB [Boudabousia marimammalium]OKL49998.1 hypothetical protein BM477_03645 [Boudabousia marimammalium]
MSDKKYSSGYRAKRKADSARLAALDVLAQVREEDAYANLVLADTLRDYGVEGRDAAFATELTYGTLRMRGYYDALIERSASRPLKELDPLLLDVLRLGCHQLLNMRVPEHAALAETVDVARQVTSDGPSKLVNAVLRTIQRTAPREWEALIKGQSDSRKATAEITSHPEWVVEAIRDALGDSSFDATEVVEALSANNIPAKVCLAARPTLTTRAQLLRELGDQGSAAQVASTSVIMDAGDPGRVAAVKDGRAGVQDSGSQYVTEVFTSIPLTGSDREWLDLCAGPGGKAALLTGYARSVGARLTANELHKHRARLVAQNLKAFSREDYRIRVGDGRTMAEHDGERGYYDRVLLDAPCSGLGALRRRPEARWRKDPRDLAELNALQWNLLRGAVDCVRTGGLIGYITCSPHLSETRDIVSQAVAELPLELVNLAPQVVDLPDALTTDGCIQLWPHRHGSDAMFLAVLRKK